MLTQKDVNDLVKSVDLPVRSIESQIGIPIGILGRAITGNRIIPLPCKWEQPLIEFVKKYIAEKKESAKATVQTLATVKGEALPDVIPPELSDEELASKKSWHKKVHDAVAPFVVSRFLTGEK